jgi:alpha-tubulin suppressor-like RCC1 family protein
MTNEELRIARERILKYQGVICAGGYHTVGLKADGTVVAVSHNFSASLSRKRCDVDSWRDIISVAAGVYHTVGLKADDSVVAVGSNEEHDFYSGTCSGWCNVLAWRDIVAISASSINTVGLKSNGTVVVSGSNRDGQCDTDGWRDIIAVCSGGYCTIGLRADGTVISTYNDVADLNDVVAISSGFALKLDGTVVAISSSDGKVTPIRNMKYNKCDTSDWRDVIAVSAGDGHAVGLKVDGSVLAIGNNTDNQCNTADWRDIVAITAGGKHTVGLKADGTVLVAGGTYLTDHYEKIPVHLNWNNISPSSDEKRCELRMKEEEYRATQIKQEEHRLKQRQENEQKQRALWVEKGLCPYCGGKLSILFKKCKSCGKRRGDMPS